MPIPVIDKIKQKNDAKFFIMDAEDVEYDGKALPESFKRVAENVEVEEMIDEVLGNLVKMTDKDGNTVDGKIVSGKGTGVMYVSVDPSLFTTEDYPSVSTTCYAAPNGYVFGGWYNSTEEGDCCTEYPTGDAYAKFVDADVLSIQGAFVPAKYNDDKTDLSNSWRFVSSIDSVDYLAAYFVIDGSRSEITSTHNPLTVGNDEDGGGLIVFTPSMLSSASLTLTTAMIRSTADPLTDSHVVKTGWLTSDGTTVYGYEYRMYVAQKDVESGVRCLLSAEIVD